MEKCKSEDVGELSRKQWNALFTADHKQISSKKTCYHSKDVISRPRFAKSPRVNGTENTNVLGMVVSRTHTHLTENHLISDLYLSR